MCHPENNTKHSQRSKNNLNYFFEILIRYLLYSIVEISNKEIFSLIGNISLNFKYIQKSTHLQLRTKRTASLYVIYFIWKKVNERIGL